MEGKDRYNFKSIAIWAIVLVFLGCSKEERKADEVFPVTKAECSATAVENRFIVQWKDGSTSIEESTDRDTFINDVVEPNIEKIEFAENDQVIRLPHNQDLSSFKVFSSSTEGPHWGQEIIGAPALWEQNVEGENIVVAIIDSGVDITHDQLKNQLYTNTKEIANGIDDDKNGYIDDINGYDFFDQTGIVTDPSGHGTHVAGVIAADHTNGDALGVAPKAKILPLRFIGADGSGNLSDAMLAMDYAVAHGAKVINASWGGAPCSKSLREKIQKLEDNGILFISAAGNVGTNLDETPEYPAAYGAPNQITVGASTARDLTADFSNFGYQLVHIMAPGMAIYSTFPENGTLYMSGTSMATPFVSGAAALLWSAFPNASYKDIRSAILDSVNKGNFEVMSRGRLDVKNALDLLRARLASH